MYCKKCENSMEFVGFKADGRPVLYHCESCDLWFNSEAGIWLYSDGEVYHGETI